MTKLPTNAELSKLQLPAIVAYAIRCTRRVQPLFSSAEAEHVELYQTAIENAIRVAERICLGEAVNAAVIRDAAKSALHAARCGRPAEDVACAVAACADSAAAAAADNAADAVASADAAAVYAAAAATEVGAGLQAYAAATEDYKRLKAKFGRAWFGAGREAAPIDTSAKGPLGPYWPKGEPKWGSAGGG